MPAEPAVRTATPADTKVVAELLDAFHREFDTPTPGPAVLASRLERLLTDGQFVVLLSGDPAVGVAVVTFRPGVWCDGPVALLDELYVKPELRGQRIGGAILEAACQLATARHASSLEIPVDGEDFDARRFYEAHGFANTEPGAAEPMYFYYRDLG